MRSVAMTPDDVGNWNSLQWRRRLERFGDDDGPVIAAGAGGEVDGVWYDAMRNAYNQADYTLKSARRAHR